MVFSETPSVRRFWAIRHCPHVNASFQPRGYCQGSSGCFWLRTPSLQNHSWARTRPTAKSTWDLEERRTDRASSPSSSPAPIYEPSLDGSALVQGKKCDPRARERLSSETKSPGREMHSTKSPNTRNGNWSCCSTGTSLGGGGGTGLRMKTV